MKPLNRWRLSWWIWLSIAAFCAFAEFAGNFSTGGRINGWSDVIFIVAFAFLGLIAFINSLYGVSRWLDESG
jgi:hypothetical protein